VYLERFGLLCLLKLRCGDRFGSRAGGAWQLLFVLCLMPWLRKYRSSSLPSHNALEFRPMEDDDSENIKVGLDQQQHPKTTTSS
jgi:hypothetical protein